LIGMLYTVLRWNTRRCVKEKKEKGVIVKYIRDCGVRWTYALARNLCSQ
jgi:hypothetical protein